MATIEPEILDARRAFPTSQGLLGGPSVRQVQGLVVTGWHDTSVSGERPSFAVVRRDGPQLDLIGEIIRVSYADRSVFAYVLGSALIPVDLSLARRAFLAIGLLAAESIDATVDVVA